MFSAPTSAVVAGIQALVVGGALLYLGYLLAGAALGLRGDWVLRAGLALPALCGYVLVLSILHIVSGGAILSNPWVVRLLTLVVAVAAFVMARHGGTIGGRSGLALALLLLGVGVLVWGIPLVRELPLFETTPLVNGGDTKLHLGWSMQLLNGETTPSSPLTGEIPNYYPWFFHAFLAFVSNLTPGGRSVYGLGPLQILQVGGGILTFFALGRAVTRRVLGAWSGAVLGALSGGFGWLIAWGPELEKNRDDPMTYLGDLALVRSYNPSFHNLAPTLPRDLTYVLFPAFLLLLVTGLRKERRWHLAAAGATAGIIGLTGAETFFLCGLIALGLPLVVERGRKLQTFAWVALPLAAVWSVWLIPLAFSYVELGGFVNTTTVGTVDVPPVGILGAWGLLTICAAAGALPLWKRRRGKTGGLLLVTVGAAAVLVPLAAITGNDGPIGVLGRPHRYWPLLYLALVPVGSIGIVWLAKRVGGTARARRIWALAVLVVAVPSPVLGSLALSSVWDDPPPLVTDAIEDEEGSVLVELDPHAGGETCVAAVPEGVVHSAFWWSGFRFVHYRWSPDRETNLARVRWADMNEVVPWDEERANDNEVLEAASEDGWRYLEDKYGLDVAITSDGDVIHRTDCGS